MTLGFRAPQILVALVGVTLVVFVAYPLSLRRRALEGLEYQECSYRANGLLHVPPDARFNESMRLHERAVGFPGFGPIDAVTSAATQCIVRFVGACSDAGRLPPDERSVACERWRHYARFQADEIGVDVVHACPACSGPTWP